jgi:ABC-2 type transport system permease protein
MKLLASVSKTFAENIRDWKVLALVLVFAPFFIFLMYLFYGSAPTAYKVGIINSDGGGMSKSLSESFSSFTFQEQQVGVRLVEYDNLDTLKRDIRERTIDLGMEIPAGYSEALIEKASGGAVPARVNLYGSLGNTNYAVAAVLVSGKVYSQGMEAAHISLPTEVRETLLEQKQTVSGFDSYVPGGIALAALMILFTASASIVKENDKKTLVRLKLSRLGTINFLAGISIVQALIGSAAIVLSYWTALAFGYRPAGSFRAVLVVGVFSSISMVAVSLLVSSFLNTIFDVLTIGCFPFFIMMFFSGSMLPLPKMTVFMLFGHAVGVTDLLPLTHTADAFNKILNDGAGCGGVRHDLLMLFLTSVLYFLVGVFLYRKRKLSKA